MDLVPEQLYYEQINNPTSQIIRYPDDDDYKMLNRITHGPNKVVTFPIHFNPDDYSSVRELITELSKNQGRNALIPTTLKDIYKLLKKKRMLEDDMLPIFKPILELRNSIEMSLQLESYEAEFCIMVPPCKGLATSGQYLQDETVAFGRHHLDDGILGFLIVDNPSGNIYADKFGKHKTEDDWKGLFVANKDTFRSIDYIDSPLTGQALGVTEGSEDWGRATADAANFDAIRGQISRELCQFIRPPKLPITTIEGCKKLFDELDGKYAHSLYVTKLGLLMPSQNKLECNVTGFGKIPVTVYPRDKRPIIHVELAQEPLMHIIGRFLDNLPGEIDLADIVELAKERAKKAGRPIEEGVEDIKFLTDEIKRDLVSNNNFLISLMTKRPIYDHEYLMRSVGLHSIYSNLLKHNISSIHDSRMNTLSNLYGKQVTETPETGPNEGMGGPTRRIKSDYRYGPYGGGSKQKRRKKSRKSRRNTLKKRPRKTLKKRPIKTLKKRSKRSKRSTKRR